MDKEDVPQVPPPPSAPLGLGGYHNQISKKMDKEEVHPPPRPLGFRRYHNQNPIKGPICLLSPPNHPHTLPRRPGRDTRFSCFSCGEKKSLLSSHDDHFFCKICDVEFHHGCHTFPRKLTHPYHLNHPLTLTFRNYETGIISDGNIDRSLFSTVLSDTNKSRSIEARSQCKWCGKDIEGNWFYRCSICSFILDLPCSQTTPLLLIPNPKSHHHPLLSPCDACGLVNVLEPSYACFQCNYMVHQSCIDLPRVIKITRHQHRLSHTPCLHSTTSPCRICYKTVDTTYGQYSCNHGDCTYVVHSKCATHENIWDGKELEWEPEESDKTEDIAPFKTVGKDLILHFSHHHFLKLEKFDGVRDAEKQCQACILPINSHDFYNCVQCDYFLHEVCAGLLRKLDHALHVHPLILHPTPIELYSALGCLVCSRKSTGFRYRCPEEICLYVNKVEIDVRCILVPEYFTHTAHEHPLFISTSYKDENNIFCKGCKEMCAKSYLQCTVCKFAMCYKCATIPTEVSYKFDKHPLSICYGELAKGMYWCELCEKEVTPMDWFYKCNECCITVHIQCVFGSSIYMKPGFMFEFSPLGWSSSCLVEVFRNSFSSRPLCDKCGHRCPSSVYYRFFMGFSRVACSLNCLETQEEYFEPSHFLARRRHLRALSSFEFDDSSLMYTC